MPPRNGPPSKKKAKRRAKAAPQHPWSLAGLDGPPQRADSEEERELLHMLGFALEKIQDVLDGRGAGCARSGCVVCGQAEELRAVIDQAIATLERVLHGCSGYRVVAGRVTWLGSDDDD